MSEGGQAGSAPGCVAMGDRRYKMGLIVLLALYCAYAVAFIYRTSFVINGERYFSLFDDGMIAMRYAKHLAEGAGLVWNAGGARVEGFTDPLWVLLMAGFHLLPLGAAKMSLCVQVSGALFLALNLFFVWQISYAISNGSRMVGYGAVLVTASYLPLNNWGLQGMEVSLLTLLVTYSVWLAMKCLEENRATVWLYVVLGAATFIRPDMVVPFLGITLFLVLADARNRGKNILTGFVVLGLCVFSQTAFRMWYFGEILPNTYYLKISGYPALLRMSRGLFVLADFIWKANIGLFLLPVILLFFRPRKDLLLLAWVFWGQMMYSVYIGGDAWEWWGGSNRYLCIAMPCFFCILSLSLSYLQRQFVRVLREARITWMEKKREVVGNVSFCCLIGFSLISFNSIHGPKALAEWLLIKPPMQTEYNRNMVETALLLKKITRPGASIAVVWAGVLPYFLERKYVDLLGKTDKHIARQKMRPSKILNRFIDFYPGHMKYDYKYSIGDLRPEVVLQLWRDKEEAVPYLELGYKEVTLARRFTMYLRKDARNVIWDKVERLG